jgi:hypothetical protein
MADSSINVQGTPNAQGSANLVDTTSITIPSSGQTVQRQRIVLGDPFNPVGLANVDSVLGAYVYTGSELVNVMRLVLAELQQITQLLGGVSPTA